MVSTEVVHGEWRDGSAVLTIRGRVIWPPGNVHRYKEWAGAPGIQRAWVWRGTVRLAWAIGPLAAAAWAWVISQVVSAGHEAGFSGRIQAWAISPAVSMACTISANSGARAPVVLSALFQIPEIAHLTTAALTILATVVSAAFVAEVFTAVSTVGASMAAASMAAEVSMVAGVGADTANGGQGVRSRLQFEK